MLTGGRLSRWRERERRLCLREARVPTSITVASACVLYEPAARSFGALLYLSDSLLSRFVSAWHGNGIKAGKRFYSDGREFCRKMWQETVFRTCISFLII